MGFSCLNCWLGLFCCKDFGKTWTPTPHFIRPFQKWLKMIHWSLNLKSDPFFHGLGCKVACSEASSLHSRTITGSVIVLEVYLIAVIEAQPWDCINIHLIWGSHTLWTPAIPAPFSQHQRVLVDRQDLSLHSLSLSSTTVSVSHQLLQKIMSPVSWYVSSIYLQLVWTRPSWHMYEGNVHSLKHRHAKVEDSASIYKYPHWYSTWLIGDFWPNTEYLMYRGYWIFVTKICDGGKTSDSLTNLIS